MVRRYLYDYSERIGTYGNELNKLQTQMMCDAI
jgi:hypothetical protein